MRAGASGVGVMPNQASECAAERKAMLVQQSHFPFLERFSARAGEFKSIRKIDDLENLLLKIERSSDFAKDANNTYNEVASGAYYWYQFMYGAFVSYTEAVKLDDNPFYIYLKDVYERTNFDPGLKNRFDAGRMPKIIGRRFSAFESMMLGTYDDAFSVIVFTDLSSGHIQIVDDEGNKFPAKKLDGYHRVFSAFVTGTDRLKYTVMPLS